MQAVRQVAQPVAQARTPPSPPPAAAAVAIASAAGQPQAAVSTVSLAVARKTGYYRSN